MKRVPIAVVAACLVMSAAVVAGCANPSPRTSVAAAAATPSAVSTPTTADGWTTFSGQGVSFDHPTAWVSYPGAAPNPGGYAPAVYLSTTAFGPLCTPTTDLAGNPITACHAPEPDLSDGGTFVDWTYESMPVPGGSPLDRYSGTPTTVAGHDAVLNRSTLPTGCTATGAASGELVAIDITHGSVLVMTACFGPGDVDTQQADVDRMVASLRAS